MKIIMYEIMKIWKMIIIILMKWNNDNVINEMKIMIMKK